MFFFFFRSLKRCPVSPVLERGAGEISNEASSGTRPQRDDRISDGEGVEKSD